VKRFALILAVASALFGAPFAFAGLVTYNATLNGSNEFPGNASPGVGFASIRWDSVTHMMGVQVTFSGLTGTVTASHIHCCTSSANMGAAGVATVTPTFTGFPLGITSGTYDSVFDMSLPSSFNSAFITAHGGSALSAETGLFAGMSAEQTYFNIHTSTFGGGEIRGFLVQQVPEPASLALMGIGLAGLGFSLRKRRSPSLS
jgi:hypothetical protein